MFIGVNVTFFPMHFLGQMQALYNRNIILITTLYAGKFKITITLSARKGADINDIIKKYNHLFLYK